MGFMPIINATCPKSVWLHTKHSIELNQTFPTYGYSVSWHMSIYPRKQPHGTSIWPRPLGAFSLAIVVPDIVFGTRASRYSSFLTIILLKNTSREYVSWIQYPSYIEDWLVLLKIMTILLAIIYIIPI
jgi:hypothetical protein